MQPIKEILRVEVGSTAHGTGLAGHEDRDELSVVVETPKEVFGLSKEGLRTKMERTQPEGVRSGPGDLDLTIYSLRTFIQLASAGNPSIMAALWAPTISKTPEGNLLIKKREKFIGRHVIPRYRGYMKSQGLRLLGLKGSGHGKRGGGRREELIAEHGFDTKYAMHAARLGFQCIELLETFNLQLPMPPGSNGDWLRELRKGNVSFDEWWETCLDLDSKMERMLNDITIPEQADQESIVKASVWIHKSIWRWLD